MNNQKTKKGLNRRSFLRSTAAVGAGLAFSPMVFGQAGGGHKADDINVALLGAGAQGTVLMNACLKIPGIRFKAICDIWSYGQQYGLNYLKKNGHEVNVYEDYREMLAVEDIVKHSRKTYANLALLGDKSFLLSDNRNCFIMYGIEGHSWIAMGDPVGSEGEWEPLVWKYRELCDRQDCWPVFYQIDKRNLDLYLNLGMTFLKLGEEARVPLKDFSLEGSSRKSLRYTCNKVERENCTFGIIPCDEVNHELDQLKHISDSWLKEKNTREKSFSIGFFKPDYLRKTPIAVVRREGEIVAFANIWLGAEKEELSIDLMRHLSSAPNGTMEYLFIELMLWGKQQGYDWFSLGMAPMSGLEDRELAPLWHKLGTFIFRHGEHFYNFRGLRQYKEKFDPFWESKYLACPRGFMLPRILANLATLISGSIKGVVAK